MICKLIKNIHKEIVERFNYGDLIGMYGIANLDYDYNIHRWVIEINHIMYYFYSDVTNVNRFKQIQ